MEVAEHPVGVPAGIGEGRLEDEENAAILVVDRLGHIAPRDEEVRALHEHVVDGLLHEPHLALEPGRRVAG